MFQYPEALYPTSFRQKDVLQLRQHLDNYDSVVLIGMKRVGISNFLRFLLYQPEVHRQVFGDQKLITFVDLNDLVECTPSAFWTVMLKRLVDAIEASDLPERITLKAKKLFVESIQLKDVFFTMDSTQKILRTIVSEGFYPIVIMTRFDRLLPILTPEFFSNLQSLKDAAGQLSYIFTSYRPLDQLAPEVLSPSSLNLFVQNQYLQPLTQADTQVILQSLHDRYHFSLSTEIQMALSTLTGGHVQYLHLSMIACNDGQCTAPTLLLQSLVNEESISLQSEELFESLQKEEQQVLQHAFTSNTSPSFSEYLTQTGFVTTDGQLFSPLFAEWLASQVKQKKQLELSRQEQRLFTVLKEHLGEIVERYEIIEAVWPDQIELGVSDWAIDRLIARLRAKMRSRQDPFKILTVVTRGYKMVETSKG